MWRLNSQGMIDDDSIREIKEFAKLNDWKAIEESLRSLKREYEDHLEMFCGLLIQACKESGKDSLTSKQIEVLMKIVMDNVESSIQRTKETR